jgi:hypothetical protein
MMKPRTRIRARHRVSPYRVCALFLLCVLTNSGNLPANTTAEEYSVKAAFLFHFAQFVDWPAETFKGAGTPLVYCTIGADPFHGALDASLSGKSVGTHPIQVQHFKQTSDLQGCHIVFIGENERRLFSTVFELYKGNPVLIVGESERFAQEGGMIGFCVEENKIRFDINLEVAEKAGLKISSRLLVLARTVIGGQRGT